MPHTSHKTDKNNTGTQSRLRSDAKKAGRDPLFRLTRHRPGRPFALEIIFSTLKMLLIAVLVAGFGGMGLAYGVAKTYIDTTPPLETTQVTKSARTSFLYDKDGKEITSISAIEYRDWAGIDEIPDMLKHAVISVEDVRFYKHKGVDMKRLFSAALEILGNSNSSGGSTLTQQLVKNRILGSERSYKRKVQEAYLALELEKVMEKTVILEAYLNDIYLGGSNYGVKAASKDYFGKEMAELTVRECAMIAGLTQNPYRYNPRLNTYFRDEGAMRATDTRTDWVLKRMYQSGYINSEQYESALLETVAIVESSENAQMYDMAYFIEYAIADVVLHWMEKDGVPNTAAGRAAYENKLRTGGYKIYTTVDPFIQNTVQQTLAGWDKYPNLADKKNSVITEIISDSVIIETIQPQAAAVVIEQATGELRAIVGGREEPYVRKGFNRAAQSYTEVGSAIKPIAVYAPALDLNASPATVIANVDGAIEGWGGETGYPKGGLSGKYYGPVTARVGLVQSLNVAAGRTLFEHTTVAKSLEYMGRMGIPASQLNPDGPGLALGTSGITPIQMTAAYAAIANNGYYLEPLSFTKVVDPDGNVILDADLIRGGTIRVFEKASTPYLIVDILKDAVSSGTGRRARIDGYQVAGKTGTNADYASVYFAGMTCKYTSVVWVGHDQPANKLVKGASGGDYAAPLWQSYMSKILEGVESENIIRETAASLGLVQRTVCPVSGLLSTEACVQAQSMGDRFKLVTDWFDYQSVPKESCDMHVTLRICGAQQFRAGSECPTASVTERTFILIRPDSRYHSLDDEVLTRVFGSVYRRTDKSLDAYIDEFPICPHSGSLAELTDRRTELIAEVEAFIAGTGALSLAHTEQLWQKVGVLRDAVGVTNISAALSDLQTIF
ncbi:MAG: transglycosylase domain-containing protein, partial [Clostridiales bacterium]|nr:transglycosylase domain-containing protein [Clostridiales bacterium]